MIYPVAIGVTLVVELLLVACMTKTKAWLIACVAVNLLTHPTAWTVNTRVDALELIELVVIAVETIGYRVATGASLRKSLLIAVIANGATWALSYWL